MEQNKNLNDQISVPTFIGDAYYRKLECDEKREELFAKWEKQKEQKQENKKLIIAFVIFIVPVLYLAGYMQQITGSVL